MSVGANGGVVSNCSHGGVFCGSRRRLHLSYVVSLCYDRGIDVGSQFTICQFMLLGDTSRRRRLSNCVLRECVRRRALGARAAQIPRRCSGVAVRVGDDNDRGTGEFPPLAQRQTILGTLARSTQNNCQRWSLLRDLPWPQQEWNARHTDHRHRPLSKFMTCLSFAQMVDSLHLSLIHI